MTDGTVGKCSVPMWMAGCPAGTCGKPAYGVFIPGEMFRDAWNGERRRFDGKWNGYVPDLACPRHGGPDKFGPRAFTDGLAETGRPMWCAVYEDFVNLMESPAEFHERPWIAIAELQRKHPRPRGTHDRCGGGDGEGDDAGGHATVAQSERSVPKLGRRRPRSTQ